MRCRLCRNRILEDREGCAVCLDAKKALLDLKDNLHNPRFDGNNEVDLKTMNQQVLRLAKHQMDQLEKEQRLAAAPDAPGCYDDVKTAEILKLSMAVQKGMAESIKLEKELKKQSQNLSTDSKIELMIEFFYSLPHEKQLKIVMEVTKIYNESGIGKIRA